MWKQMKMLTINQTKNITFISLNLRNQKWNVRQSIWDKVGKIN